MADDTAIKVDNVNKAFRLPHEKQNSIKGMVVNLHKRKKTFEEQEVLKNVSFEIKKGEFFGIVGRNGSGKSTLLKLLAGIYTPDSGSITVNGKLTPFIELGVGFNPELTGRENVFLNGALLGFNRKEMEVMYKDIVDFAELERFMDQKLKNYSSGMQVRLAFSIAIRAQSDILLLDEVLAVGDAEFQRKCYEYFMSLKEEGQTVILVTHDMNAVRQYCDRGVMIENGAVIKIGKAEAIAQEYLKLFSTNEETASNPVVDDRWGEGGIIIGLPKIKVGSEKICITTTFKATKDIPAPIYGFTVFNSAGVNILEANTKKEKKNTSALRIGQVAKLVWDFPNVLTDGKYDISVACCDQSATRFYEWYNRAGRFDIKKNTRTAGIINPAISVKENKEG